MPFVVTKLVRLFTIKDTKLMKAPPTYPLARKQDFSGSSLNRVGKSYV